MERAEDIRNERIHQLEVKLWVERQELALLPPNASVAAREVYGTEVRRLEDELTHRKPHRSSPGEHQPRSRG